MEPGSNHDEVVNMTRAMEALSPWINHPRRTISKVEDLVVVAAALLLLQLILGPLRRRWHNSFVSNVLRAFSQLMNPLIIYTLGTMQPTPIKNSSYPVWAAFLIFASAGTSAFRQYDFYDSFDKKVVQVMGEYTRDLFFALMFILLIDPNTYTLKTALDLKRKWKNARASSNCVVALVSVLVFTKVLESTFLAFLDTGKFIRVLKRMKSRGKRAAERTEESENDRERADDSDPRSMKGYNYAVYSSPCRLITIDQIWGRCGTSADGKELIDLCLSCALFQRLMEQRYFGEVYPKTSLLKDHDFVFKKLLSSEGDFKRAFRIIEVELGFCYDFFFTKYYSTFLWTNLPVPFIQYLIFLKTIVILIVLVLAIRKSLVLETPNPIIEVKISQADYIITLLLLFIALIVELVQITIYLASNWAQVSLGCMYVKNYWCLLNASISETIIGIFRRFDISVGLSNKIEQRSIVFGLKLQNPVVVTDAVKRAVARKLISIYRNNPTSNRETSLWQNQMVAEYSWALRGLPRVEAMLIWHIATEYCDISSPIPSSQTTRYRCSKHRGFAAHLFGRVLQLFAHRRYRITHLDIHRGVAVHLSRYCAYLIRSVPELLPYPETDTAEFVEQVMEERTELFGSSYRTSMIYGKMKNLQGTEEEDDPQKIFEKGIKLGKQLERMADGDRWKVLEDFWAETIIHAAISHYTTKQHMQHLENGGEFLTHIWALVAHAGILNLKKGKDQKGQDKPAV